MDKPTGQEFREAGARRGIIAELWGFMSHYRKWWLLPILMIFLALGVMVATGSSAIAPFIYALF